ncbi:MAG: HAMP domain-containing protein [Rhodobacteraceae bacterium]|nr:MAG: HAMP domain-containing protein [Paracoccaceae bacterium]
MSLRSRLLTAIVAAAVIAGLATGAPLFLGAERLMRDAAARQLDSVNDRFDAAMEDEIAKSLSLAATYALNPDFGRAMATGDRESLAAALGPGFPELRSVHGVVQVQFHLPPATSFLRLHALDNHGDDLSSFRHTVVEANRTQRAVAGLERGRGGIGVRAVHPVSHEGVHVGTVEFGMDFSEAFFTRLARGEGDEAEFYLFPADNVATFAAEDAREARAASTFAGPSLLSLDVLNRVRAGESVDAAFEIDGRPYHGRAIPIRDYAGRVAGAANLLISTEAFAATSAAVTRAAVLSAAAGLIVAGSLGWFFSRWIGNQLVALGRRMGALADGDLTSPIADVDRNDEVGAMARALEVFRANAAEVETLRASREAADRDAKARHDAMAARLAAGIGDVVAAVAKGDFSRRVACDFDEPALNDLGAAVNALAESVSDSVGAVRRVLAALAAGDLSQRMHGAHAGDFAALQGDLNVTADTLAELLGAISSTVEALKRTGDAMAANAHQMSDRASSQAASLEQTSATMEQMSATVASNASTAEQAAERAGEVADASRRSQEAIETVVERMRGISASADRIASITGAIESIAMQTNLLALNAAVEAARAGDAGRGFAVVASEVRTLARRASEAASEINGLIGESQTAVAKGVEGVDGARALLTDVAGRIGDLDALIADISSASREQALGVREVSTAVASLDQVTQENARIADQSEAVVSAVVAETRRLEGLAARFAAGARGRPARAA